MTRPRAVVLVALATLVLGLAALFGLPVGRAGLRLYLVAVAAVAFAALGSELRQAVPPAPPSAFEGALRRQRTPASDRPAALTELEGLLASRLSAGEVHFRLRPLLREVASSRLRTARGVDLDAEPEVARRLLGPAAWELVRPDRDAPEVRLAPGLELADLRPVVEALEALR